MGTSTNTVTDAYRHCDINDKVLTKVLNKISNDMAIEYLKDRLKRLDSTADHTKKVDMK